MPTEDKKKARSENLDALSTENESKYAMSENMVHVRTEEEIRETSSDFDIYKTKFSREDGFFP